jgi:ATP synthase protein I
LPESKKSPKAKPDSQIRRIGLLGTIPILLAVGPVVGFLIGRWLDEKLGTEPILLVVFLVFGFVAAGKEVYRIIKKAEETDDN